MKKKRQLLNSRVLELVLASVIVFLMLTLASCNRTKSNDTKEIAEEHNEAKFANLKEDDAKFLVNAEEINLEEITLGRLAHTRGLSAQIKELGEMMVTEHTKASSDLQALATQKQVTLPATLTNDGESANKRLMDNKLSDFDKEYADMMVSGHKDAIDKFEKASTDCTDPDIRNFASSMVPKLRQHLDAFVTIQKQL